MIKLKTIIHDMLIEAKKVDINDIADKLTFKPVTKKKLTYKFIEDADVDNMPKLSYTISKKPQQIVTMTSTGEETKNTAAVDDVIVSGVTGELYVLKEKNFKKNYDGNINGNVYPEQSPRQVAIYKGDSIKFEASWGEDMILKDGDYLVKEKDGGGYYRIDKIEFDKTYNKI